MEISKGLLVPRVPLSHLEAQVRSKTIDVHPLESQHQLSINTFFDVFPSRNIAQKGPK